MQTKLAVLAENILRRMQEKGVDEASCTVESETTEELNIDNGSFSLYRTLYDKNLLLTAIRGRKRGLIRKNGFDEDSVEKAIEECLSMAENGTPDEAWGMAPVVEEASFSHGVFEPDMDKFFLRTKEFLEDVRREYPTVELNQVINTYVRKEKVYRNTSGTCFTTEAGYYGISLMLCAREGTKTSSFTGCGLFFTDLERPFAEIPQVKEQLESVVRQVHTVNLNGTFKGTALLVPSCFEELLNEAIDDFASGFSIMQGTAKWADMQNRQVASPLLSVSFAPHHEKIIVGQDYTAEGFLAKDDVFIERGVLRSFRTDLYTHRKTGKPLAGNTSSAIVVEAGDMPLADIIAGIEKGILVGRFSGGSPASNGDFSGVAKNSFLIENGKVTDALAEVMISGNLGDAFMNIRAVSKEREENGVSLVPYVACDGMTVSGK